MLYLLEQLFINNMSDVNLGPIPEVDLEGKIFYRFEWYITLFAWCSLINCVFVGINAIIAYHGIDIIIPSIIFCVYIGMELIMTFALIRKRRNYVAIFNRDKEHFSGLRQWQYNKVFMKTQFILWATVVFDIVMLVNQSIVAHNNSLDKNSIYTVAIYGPVYFLIPCIVQLPGDRDSYYKHNGQWYHRRHSTVESVEDV